jgi:hypothetical protein
VKIINYTYPVVKTLSKLEFSKNKQKFNDIRAAICQAMPAKMLKYLLLSSS